MLKLRHWVHSRWHIDNEQNFTGDVFAILEKAKTGAGFQLLARHEGAARGDVGDGFRGQGLGRAVQHGRIPGGYHHGVNEVWSNEYAKWVLMDGEYDFHFERDGQVLSALEVHEAAQRRRAPDRQGSGSRPHRGPDERSGVSRLPALSATGGLPITFDKTPSPSRVETKVGW